MLNRKILSSTPWMYEPQESETIPGQSLTVSQIITKFQNGTLGNIAKPFHYDTPEGTPYSDEEFDAYDPTMSPDFDLVDAARHLAILSAKRRETKEHSSIAQQPPEVSPSKEPDTPEQVPPPPPKDAPA